MIVIKFIVYGVFVLSGILKLMTNYSVPIRETYNDKHTFPLNIILGLFSKYSHEDIAEAKNEERHHMKFSNICGNIFYITAALSFLIFCFTQ